MAITGIILTGGKSRRMGQDKAFIRFKGKYLIQYSIELAEVLTDEIIISGPGKQYEQFAYRILSDNYVNAGPLAGLEACIRASRTNVNIVMPCDTPFLNPLFYRELLEHTPDYDIVAARTPANNVEPLAAVYMKSALPIIEQQLQKQDYKVQNLLKAARTKYVDFLDAGMFSNMNTPEDLTRLR